MIKDGATRKIELDGPLKEATKLFEEVHLKYLQIIDNTISKNEQIIQLSSFNFMKTFSEALTQINRKKRKRK